MSGPEIPFEIKWQELSAFRDGFYERVDKIGDNERLRQIAKDFVNEAAEQLQFVIEDALADNAVDNVANSIACSASRQASSLIRQALMGDDDAFRSILGIQAKHTRDMRDEGREAHLQVSGSDWRIELMKRHAGLFVSEILADMQARINFLERENDWLRSRY